MRQLFRYDRTMTRWLSDDEQAVWRAYMHSTLIVSSLLERQLQRDSAVSHAEYEVLVRLSEAPERRLRMSELADRSQHSRSRLSHTISRMEASGWVVREHCDADRRGTWATLTEEGFDVLAEAAKGHVEAVRSALFDPLSEDQVASLGSIMRTVRDAHQGECDRTSRECP
jgi:DNA-binding MarR family transcriptional regulator